MNGSPIGSSSTSALFAQARAGNVAALLELRNRVDAGQITDKAQVKEVDTFMPKADAFTLGVGSSVAQSVKGAARKIRDAFTHS